MARISSVRTAVVVGGLIAVSSAALGAILDSSLSTLDRPPATTLPPTAGEAPGPPSLIVPNPPGTASTPAGPRSTPTGPQPSDAGPPASAPSSQLPVRTGSVTTTPVLTVALPLPVSQPGPLAQPSSLGPVAPADEVAHARGLNARLEDPSGPTGKPTSGTKDKTQHGKKSLADATVQPQSVTSKASHGPAQKPTKKPAEKAAQKPAKKAGETVGKPVEKPVEKPRHEPRKAAPKAAPHHAGKAKGHPAQRRGQIRFR